MKKRLAPYGVLVVLLICFLYGSCRKDSGFYQSKSESRNFSGSIYDFLKSQKNVYDSFLYILDRVNLIDSIKTGNYTVFAPTNPSIQEALRSMNQLRSGQGRPLLYLSTVPLNQLDSLACRYIIRGMVPSDSMSTQDGIDLHAIRYDYLMHGKLEATNAEGFVKGGPEVIEFSDKKDVIYTRQWVTAQTVSLDIKASNGLVNVLERTHVFGFDEFISRINPTNSAPFSGKPLPIPGVVGMEQYDKGGERVAYHDADPTNNGGAYRPEEGVDIEQSGGVENGYDLAYTSPLEWINYTVNIADTGKYLVMFRVASPNNTGAFHLRLDNKKLTGAIKSANTGSYTVYTNIYDTVRLPKGRHVLTFTTDYGGYNLRFMKFTPLDRPFPVPGTIMAADFDQGGEGVAYHDFDAENQGGAYRLDEGVDIEQNPEGGGYDVGYTNPGEWMNYTIDVKETGQYKFTAMVGSPLDPNGGQRFHVEIDGDNVTGSLVCPNTGGWQSWTDVSTVFFLERGTHVMRFYEETGLYNVRSFTFEVLH